jgi:hypothetical protein
MTRPTHSCTVCGQIVPERWPMERIVGGQRQPAVEWIGEHCSCRGEFEPLTMVRAERLAQRALSVRQPYAWLLANCYKDCENRSRLFGYVGRLFIHASKEPEADYDRLAQTITDAFEIVVPPADEIDLGCLVGVMFVNQMVSQPGMLSWWAGPNAWPVRWAVPIKPVPMRGSLGLWRVPGETPITLV